jgi:hypothetical protein
MRSKNVARILGLLIAPIVALNFYRNATEDDILPNILRLGGLLAILSVLMFDGYNELVDHYYHEHHDHGEAVDISYSDANTPSTSSPASPAATVTQDEPTASSTLLPHSKNHRRIKLLQAIGVGMTLPPAGAAVYNLFMQGLSLMRSVTAVDGLIYSFGGLAGLLLTTQYIIVPGLHIYETIKGTHADFVRRVTGSFQPVTGRLTLLKYRIPVFCLYTATHLTSAVFLSKDIRDKDALFILSIIGIAGGKAIVHTNHMAALWNAWDLWRGQRICPRISSTITGIGSALTHSSSEILSAIYYWSDAAWWLKGLMTLAATLDAGTGFVEHLQHGGREVMIYAGKSNCC